MKNADLAGLPVYAQAGRISSLDSIRGLAALAVLFGHTAGSFTWPMSLAWTNLPLVNILFDGRSAVTMFFVLSGFVLARPYTLSDTPEKPARKLFFPTFFLRRITRIWIPWFCVFCLSAIIKAWFFRDYITDPPTSHWLGKFWHDPFSFFNMLRQCAYLQHDATRQLLPQDWSLGVELKGSALIPVFLFLNRKHIAYSLALSILFLLAVTTGEYYFSFMVGVLLANFYGRIESRVRPVGFGYKCAILFLGLALYQARLAGDYLAEYSVTEEKIVWCIATVGCALVLIASLNSRRIQAALNHSATVFLGRISYSVYLVQFVVLLPLLPPVIAGFNALGLHNAWFIFFMVFFCSVSMTIALSALSYRWIELPSIELGHRLTPLIQRWFNKKPGAPDSASPAQKSSELPH